MSFVNVAPEMVASAAGDLDGIRSALGAANAAAAPSTTGIAPPAMDQVSAAITAVLGTHALEYQTVSAQVADFHAQFVGALNSSASQYLSTEAANAEQSLLNAVNSPAQALLGHPLTGTGATTGTAGLGGTGSPAVVAGGVPAAGTGETEPVELPRPQYGQSVGSGQAGADRDGRPRNGSGLAHLGITRRAFGGIARRRRGRSRTSPRRPRSKTAARQSATRCPAGARWRPSTRSRTLPATP